MYLGKEEQKSAYQKFIGYIILERNKYSIQIVKYFSATN